MDTYTLTIVTLLILCVLFAIFLFIKTPKEQRTITQSKKINQDHLQKKLESYPKHYEAVLIKGKKKESIIKSIPYVLIFVPMALFTLYSTRLIDNPSCELVWGVNVTLINIFIAFIGLPLGLFIASLLSIKTGLRVVKTGYMPPLDSIRWHDVIATKTKLNKLIGMFILISPLLILIFTSYVSYKNLIDREVVEKFDKKIEKKCKEKYSLTSILQSEQE